MLLLIKHWLQTVSATASKRSPLQDWNHSPLWARSNVKLLEIKFYKNMQNVKYICACTIYAKLCTYIYIFLPQEVKFKHPFDFKEDFLTIERSSMCLGYLLLLPYSVREILWEKLWCGSRQPFCETEAPHSSMSRDTSKWVQQRSISEYSKGFQQPTSPVSHSQNHSYQNECCWNMANIVIHPGPRVKLSLAEQDVQRNNLAVSLG